MVDKEKIWRHEDFVVAKYRDGEFRLFTECINEMSPRCDTNLNKNIEVYFNDFEPN